MVDTVADMVMDMAAVDTTVERGLPMPMLMPMPTLMPITVATTAILATVTVTVTAAVMVMADTVDTTVIIMERGLLRLSPKPTTDTVDTDTEDTEEDMAVTVMAEAMVTTVNML